MKKIVLSILIIAGFSHISFSKVPSHKVWDTLLKKHVSATGKVDYKGFIKDSVQLNTYLKLISNNMPDKKTWSKNQEKAYWINAYNAFTVKLITKYYPVISIKDIGSNISILAASSPWEYKFFKIGNHDFSLNQIEHKQLREKFGDPRIHFALVCASRSCPVLLNEAYLSGTLDRQLNAQAKVFLNDIQRNDISTESPKLSKIFSWYGDDFKTKTTSLIDFINRYSTVKINPNAKISYLKYSWKLNE